MLSRKSTTTIAGAAVLAAAAASAIGLNGAGAVTTSAAEAPTSNEVAGRLNPMNNSAATGRGSITVEGRRLTVEVKARRLARKLPHAQHIHFGQKARNECPGITADRNGDFRITTTEGAGAYGPVRVSLTTKGKTGAGSVLAVDRYPTADRGEINYRRSMRTSEEVVRGIRRGNGVIVIHGVDYNHNGEYDFDSAGKSDLDPSLPAEATDPAVCGVMRVR